MIDLKPIKCNLCGGDVDLISNSQIYGKEYGSGKMYYCNSCGAYVGTHIKKPEVALGILANKEMREMKMKCHKLFDAQWIYKGSASAKRKARVHAYKCLAKKLDIPLSECNFGYFDMDMLNKAYEIMSN